MESIETMSFVERVFAGHMPAIIRLVFIMIIAVVGIVIIKKMAATNFFKAIIAAIVLLIVFGFIIDDDAMVDAAEIAINWIVTKLRSA